MDPVERLARLGGAGRAGQLVSGRTDRRRLAELVAGGLVIEHGGGCYSLPGADRDLVWAVRARGRLTCVSAALVHDMSVLVRPDRTHVAVPHSGGAAGRRAHLAREVVVHRERAALLTTVPHPVSEEGPGVVAPAEALARMLRCQEPLTAIAAVDSALNRRMCAERDIAALLSGPGTPRLRALLRECDGRSQSPLESVVRVRLRRAGLVVEANVRIGRVGFVDLLVEGRVVVEVDGFAYHSGRAEYREDRRRDRELVAQGYVVLRFTAEDVLRGGSCVLQAVCDALRAGGERPRRAH